MKLEDKFKEFLQSKYKDKYSTREINSRASDILQEDVIEFIFIALSEIASKV